MNENQWGRRAARRYPTYEPYPVSRDFNDVIYSPDSLEEPGIPLHKPEKPPAEEHSSPSDDNSLPYWFSPEPIASNEERNLGPLKLLESLFSDRLSFLERSLYELDVASRERQQMTDKALEEIDQDIADCERYLAVLKGALNNRERQRELERKVLDLKRERRQLMVSNWRDLRSLQAQSSRLRQELDSLYRTGNIRGDTDG